MTIKKTAEAIDSVERVLKNGEVVIIPTDTIYGFSSIVGEGFDTAALIRAIKGRDEKKGFIQLIGDPTDIKNITSDTVPEKLLNLWPAPLSIIVNKRCGGGTVAVRCPKDEWLRALIKRVGSPIYSTSVNYSGRPPITKILDIIKAFGEDDRVKLIVDGGDNKKDSAPSTIVKILDGGFEVVRAGAVKL